MSVFIRRFLTDPGNTVLLNIESVNILDLTPPSSITGIGSGTVLLVGEFEDGAFNLPTEVIGATDLTTHWGSLGYTYAGVVANYPCAVQRKADGALVAEYWNGNAFVQLSGKTFSRLLVCRVNTSVGTVQFSRAAYLEGSSSFRYQLTTGQILAVDTGSGFQSATFTGLAATTSNVANQALSGTVAVTNGNSSITFSVAQTLPAGTAIVFASQPGVYYQIQAAITASTTATLGTPGGATTNYTGTTNAATTSSVIQYNVTAGQTLVLGADGMVNFTVTFLSTDNTIANVIARINQYAGFTFATQSGTNGGLITFTGLQGGTGGQVRIVSGSTGVFTELGLTATTVVGTGNVANIAAVMPSEVQAILTAAITNLAVGLNSSNALRIWNTGAGGVGTGNFIAIGAATTATALGFTASIPEQSAAVGQYATNLGQAVLQSGAGTYNTGFSGGQTLTFSIDGVQYIATFQAGDQTLAQVVARINTTVGKTVAATDGTTAFTISGTLLGTAGSVAILGASAGSVLTTLGLTVATVIGVLPPQGGLPAGTIVQQPNGVIFVTMQTLTFVNGLATLPGNANPLATAGPYSIPIRHAIDDTTGVSATAGTITQITNPPDIGAFTVVNQQLTSAALTDNQIDAMYTNAMNATLDPNSVAGQANIMYSARQSNTVRQTVRTTVLAASAQGMFGRVGCIRPPLGTLKTVALSTVAAPGVGATRDQRVIYCYPGFNTTVPLIQTRGVAGNNGTQTAFTATGAVDVGSDGFMASILSQLPPEENPGQETTFLSAVNSLETAALANGTIGTFLMQDYINFKAAGIAAPRIDNTSGAIFQSGVTSVDPNVFPSLAHINRRRMADYIQDSIAIRAKAYGKRLSTVARRAALAAEMRQFMISLLSPQNPAFQRINGFTVDPKSANTPQTLAQGLYRIIIAVQTIPSLDSIVLQTTVGEQVQVNEVLPQAA